jgi:type IV pilus assembly protein PilA
VVSVTIRNINSEVNGKKVTLAPLKADGSTPGPGDQIGTWLCGGAGTDVDKKYLPASCRG